MTHPTDPRPILRALIGCLEDSIGHTEWQFDLEQQEPPQYIKDTRRTVNEAKQFLAMLNGSYAVPLDKPVEV